MSDYPICYRYLCIATMEFGIKLGLNDVMLLVAYWNSWKDKLNQETYLEAVKKYDKGTLDFTQEPNF